MKADGRFGPARVHYTRSASRRMIASTGAEKVTFTLPTWTAICSFMVIPHVARPQHRCLAACTGGLALEVTGMVEGVRVRPRIL